MKINFDVEAFKRTILPAYIDDLEDYNNRIVVLYGGAGSGKSVYATQKIIYKLLKEKRKCLIVRKTDNTIRASIYQEIVNIFYQYIHNNKKMVDILNKIENKSYITNQDFSTQYNINL